MPGIPVVARETSCSRNTDQMCRPDSRLHLSAEEELAAEESLSIYCKPVELYNILQRRAIRNPSFLQRCLQYRIKAKHKRRIQMTVSLSRTVTETQTVFPLYIFLARLVSDVGVAEYSAMYRISRLCMFHNCAGIDGNSQVQANFTLPEVNKLAVEARSRSLAILFVSSVENSNSSSGLNASMEPLDLTSFASTAGGYCLYGKVSLESLYMTWESSPNFSLGQRAEIMSTVDLLPCYLKSDFLNEDKCVSIQVPCNSENSTSKQVQITISAEEFGAKEKSSYQTYAGSEVPPSSLSHIIRLREGNVMFNYRYYNNKLQRTEVTEDFSCPFCLVKCASFKGLRYHLPSSHDLLNFEFWVTDEFQAVNVSVKTDILRSEIVADGVDPKLQTFFFCAKPHRRRRPKTFAFKNAKHVHPPVLESDVPIEETELFEKADGVSNEVRQSHPDPDYVQSISENNLRTPAVLQFAKTRKLSVELSDPRKSNKAISPDVCVMCYQNLKTNSLLFLHCDVAWQTWDKLFGIYNEHWDCRPTIELLLAIKHTDFGIQKTEESSLAVCSFYGLLVSLEGAECKSLKLLPSQLWERVIFLASLWASAHGCFRGLSLVDLQTDWQALLSC